MGNLKQNIKQYWENSEVTIKGVLGGNEQCHDSDIQYSCWFLDILKNQGHINGGKVLDCGGGIGRVSQNVLSKYFDTIDLFDQEQRFVNYVKENLKDNLKIRKVECAPMQSYNFSDKYDAIWLQWCVESLEDEEYYDFLNKCKKNLAKNGLIIVRENIINEGDESYSLDPFKIRSQDFLRQAFFDLDLKIISEYIPTPEYWSPDFLRVTNFALKPI